VGASAPADKNAAMTNHVAPLDEQLPGLARATARSARAPSRSVGTALASVNPVAQILVDVPLAHLDRPFDFSVPESMSAVAEVGARVKVRFAGREVGGYLIGRSSASDHDGRLSPIRRIVSPEPVLSPAIASLAAELARRYAGTRSDLLRLAIPPRHARVEGEVSVSAPPVDQHLEAAQGAWQHIDRSPAFLNHLTQGQAPRGVWTAAPGDDWPFLLAQAAAVTYSCGHGVVICVPDGRDVDRVDAALTSVLGAGHHVALRADSGPSARYRDFLAVSRGARRVVVGTRSAAFAPVVGLGLVVMWDDGDDLYAEPRAPYPHTREVLLTRAGLEATAVLLGGFARSVEAQVLVSSGWAHEIGITRAALRERVSVSASSAELNPDRDPHGRSARIPRVVFDAIRDGLASGPVLIHTPRGGYAPSLACDHCRSPARCRRCSGPLAQPDATSPPACSWCGTVSDPWACSVCGQRGLRAPIIGGRRTSEELGRAFPGVVVRTSDGDHVVAEVDDRPLIVVATPGAEPIASGGYATVVLLDTWLPLARTDLRTNEEAVRRWFNAAGLVRSGGIVMIVGDSSLPAIQAVVRWDPAGFAVREADERSQAHLPPAARLATILGDPGAVDDAVTLLAAPESAEVLGPAPYGDGGEARVVVRVPRRDAHLLSDALGELQRVRSVRKLDPVRIQVDPISL
jgi:primosomal protein N' (replication factor Y) (superfamily II helicase)